MFIDCRSFLKLVGDLAELKKDYGDEERRAQRWVESIIASQCSVCLCVHSRLSGWLLFGYELIRTRSRLSNQLAAAAADVPPESLESGLDFLTRLRFR